MDCVTPTFIYSVVLPDEPFYLLISCNGTTLQSDPFLNTDDVLEWVTTHWSGFGTWSISGKTLTVADTLCSTGALATLHYEVPVPNGGTATTLNFAGTGNELTETLHFGESELMNFDGSMYRDMTSGTYLNRLLDLNLDGISSGHGSFSRMFKLPSTDNGFNYTGCNPYNPAWACGGLPKCPTDSLGCYVMPVDFFKVIIDWAAAHGKKVWLTLPSNLTYADFQTLIDYALNAGVTITGIAIGREQWNPYAQGNYAWGHQNPADIGAALDDSYYGTLFKTKFDVIVPQLNIDYPAIPVYHPISPLNKVPYSWTNNTLTITGISRGTMNVADTDLFKIPVGATYSDVRNLILGMRLTPTSTLEQYFSEWMTKIGYTHLGITGYNSGGESGTLTFYNNSFTEVASISVLHIGFVLHNATNLSPIIDYAAYYRLRDLKPWALTTAPNFQALKLIGELFSFAQAGNEVFKLSSLPSYLDGYGVKNLDGTRKAFVLNMGDAAFTPSLQENAAPIASFAIHGTKWNGLNDKTNGSDFSNIQYFPPWSLSIIDY